MSDLGLVYRRFSQGSAKRVCAVRRAVVDFRGGLTETRVLTSARGLIELGGLEMEWQVQQVALAVKTKTDRRRA